ncbi:MAG TPA: NAD-dependent epimerase/dehydratase family protein [Methylomirabilota bacterium]
MTPRGITAATRRQFLFAFTGAGALTVLTTPRAGAGVDRERSVDAAAARAPRALRILILGGTGFIGPHQVRYARDRGHLVTLFNRGRTNPGLFPEVDTLHGDRATGAYDALKTRDWDVVIDNSATRPRWVREAARALTGHVKQYVFISTISVYASDNVPDADESAPLATTTEPESEDTRRLYGPLKALAEREAETAFPGNATILRPGLIVGPGDLTDRFTYWPVRLARGGEVLAPGTPADPVQIIDARDLAEFTIKVCEEGTRGVYNCLGPRSPLTMGEMLGTIRGVVATDASLTWVPGDFLAAQKVRPWVDLPVWLPPRGRTAGFARRSNRRAVEKGLTFRPLAETAAATLAFYDAQPDDRKAQLRVGLSPAREKEVLAAWHAREKKD